MWYKIKWELSNIRRHWKLFSLLLIISGICIRLFISNYILINPIVKKDNYESQTDLHNDLAVCLQQQAQAQNDAQIFANNPDLK